MLHLWSTSFYLLLSRTKINMEINNNNTLFHVNVNYLIEQDCRSNFFSILRTNQCLSNFSDDGAAGLDKRTYTEHVQTWKVHRKTKAEGLCSFRVVHLIIVRPSGTPSHHISCLIMNSQTFFKQYWSQKPLSVQSFLYPHKIMQSSLICARIPKIFQQRTGQCLRDYT